MREIQGLHSKGCDINDDCRYFVRSYYNKTWALQQFRRERDEGRRYGGEKKRKAKKEGKEGGIK